MTTIHMDAIINRADFDRLLTAVQPSVVLKVIGMRLTEFVGESFRTRGRGGWKPLAMSTLALRMRGGDAPLQDTGKYKQAFVSETDSTTYVEVGSNIKTASGLPLSKIHEEGTGPYTIRVKNARSLAAKIGTGANAAGEHGPLGFLNGGGGGRVGYWMHFGKEVHHPGIPARPVLPTLQQAETILVPVLEAMLERSRAGS